MVQAKKLEIRRRLLEVLRSVESEDYMHFTIVGGKDARVVKDAGLLKRYAGFSRAKPTDSIQSLVSGQMAEGKRVVSCNGEFYTIKIAALRERVEKLDRKQAVSENEKKHTDEQKPQWQPQKGQGYVTPKYEDTVQLAIRIEEATRDKFHAVMRAKNTTAQEFLAQAITDEVEQNPDLVKKGEHMEAAGTKKNYRTKLQILKEENTRLRGMTGTRSSHLSR